MATKKILGQYIKFSKQPISRVFDWYIGSKDVTITPQLEILSDDSLAALVDLAVKCRDMYQASTGGTDKDWTRGRKIALKRQIQEEAISENKDMLENLFYLAGVAAPWAPKKTMDDVNKVIELSDKRAEKGDQVPDTLPSEVDEIDEFEAAVAWLPGGQEKQEVEIVDGNNEGEKERE